MFDLAAFQGLEVFESLDLKNEQDACVLPGRIILNARKAATRRRFSLAHEIGHTLFPDYSQLIDGETPLFRAQVGGESTLELLCQIAASEILFPKAPFEDRLHEVGFGIMGALRLADQFDASPEAAARRMTDLMPAPAATLLFRPVTIEGKWMNLDEASGHSPYARLEAVGGTVSSLFPVRMPWRIRPPIGSAVDRAWKRAGTVRGRPQIHRRDAEVWPEIDAVAKWTAEALTLPKTHSIPREVLALLWQDTSPLNY